jgi:hypothetical protein
VAGSNNFLTIAQCGTRGHPLRACSALGTASRRNIAGLRLIGIALPRRHHQRRHFAAIWNFYGDIHRDGPWLRVKQQGETHNPE